MDHGRSPSWPCDLTIHYQGSCSSRVGALSRQLGISPNSCKAKRLLNFTRRQMKWLVDILTGHCTLQRHMYTLRLAADPLCRSCEEGVEESVIHYLCLCEAFTEARRVTLGKNYLSAEEVKDTDYSALLRYISSTQRFEQ